MMNLDTSEVVRACARTRIGIGAVSGLAISIALGSSALAQTTPAPAPVAEAELVVVTGFRASLQNAINVKRNLDVIAEVVSAEEIGKLPDTSIADALARLPGLTAQRVDGRAQRLSIRGLGPDFTTAMLNGREQVSTNDNRGVEFDQYPSELLGSVNVYKTAQANLLAQGIAGTVDMRTVRPLSRNGRTIVVGGRVERNSLGTLNPDSDEYGYRVNGAYIDQFMDGRLGVAIGVSTMSQSNQSEKTERYGIGNTAYAWVGTPIANARGAEGLKVMNQSNVLERTGVLGVVEFKPTDNFSSVVDAYYSTFNEDQRQRGFETNVSQWNGTNTVASSVVLDGRDIVAADVTNGALALRSIENTREATLAAIGWRSDWQFAEGWNLGLDLSRSSAEREDDNLETNVALTDATGTPIRFGYRYDGRNNSLALTAPAGFNDPSRLRLGSPYGWGNGYLKRPETTDEMSSARIDLRRDFSGDNAVKSIEFGVNYSDRSKERSITEFTLDTGTGAGALPASTVLGSLDLSHGGAGSVVAFSGSGLISSGALRANPNVGSFIAAKEWLVEEEVLTAFFVGNFDTEIAGMPFTGNFGVQYVATEQSSSGAFAGFGNFSPVTVTESYSEILPSANGSFEVSEDFYVRVGFARVMNRVPMTDLRISREFNYDPQRANSTDLERSPWSSGGGNPYLRPWIGLNADISIERYFGRRGYVAFAAWQKKLESYTRPGGTRILLDFSDVVVPASIAQPVLRQGYASAPSNGSGGTLKGVEFSFSLPFELINESLDGFGLTFNVAQNFSDVTYEPGRYGNTAVSGSVELPGFSKLTGGLTAYYENFGWRARVSARYRSEALQELIGFGADFEYKINQAETIVDAQIGYDFPEGMFQGLSLTLQAQNLTNEPWITQVNNPDRWLDSNTYGTTYSLSASYKF